MFHIRCFLKIPFYKTMYLAKMLLEQSQAALLADLNEIISHDCQQSFQIALKAVLSCSWHLHYLKRYVIKYIGGPDTFGLDPRCMKEVSPCFVLMLRMSELVEDDNIPDP